MATIRPYAGYSTWKDVPVTPVKVKIDWFKLGVWGGVLVFCIGFWVEVIRFCAARL